MKHLHQLPDSLLKTVPSQQGLNRPQPSFTIFLDSCPRKRCFSAFHPHFHTALSLAFGKFAGQKTSTLGHGTRVPPPKIRAPAPTSRLFRHRGFHQPDFGKGLADELGRHFGSALNGPALAMWRSAQSGFSSAQPGRIKIQQIRSHGECHSFSILFLLVPSRFF